METLKDYRQKSIEELCDFVVSIKTELTNLRFDIIRGKVKDTSALKKKRRQIAQALTVLEQKQLIKESHG